MSDTCDLSKDQMHKAEMVYTALHEGQRPREVICEVVEEPSGSLSPLSEGKGKSRIAEIQYWKVVTDGEYRYHHPFAKHARPEVCVDQTGKIFIKRGRYIVTYRGIEDRKKDKVEAEGMPKRATLLTTLGPLDWMLVEYEDGTREKIEFARSTAIVHDQNGDLHVVYSRANPRGRGQARREEMRGRHLMGARRRARSNPSRKRASRSAPRAAAAAAPQSLGQALSQERLKAMFKQSLMLGGGAIVGMMAMDRLFQVETIATNLPTNPYVKALLRVGVGVVGGLALGFAVPAVAPLAAGLAIGGVVQGGQEALAAYRARQLTPGAQITYPASFASEAERAAFLTQNPTADRARVAAIPVTPAAANRAQMAYLPAAGVTLPAGYTAYNKQACG